MDGSDVGQVDVTDEEALRAWWDVGRIASAHDQVDDYWPAWESARAGYLAPDPARHYVRLAASAGDEVVGLAQLQLEDQDNTHFAFLQLKVLPDRRGTGFGSALLAAVEDAARAERRTTVLGAVVVPLGRGSGDPHPSLDFMKHRGYVVAGVEEVKVVDLDATEDAWPGLEAEAAEKAAGYELVCWTDRAPDEHVAELARLYSLFLGEIPLGGVDLRPAAWTVERIRQFEDLKRSTGRQQVLVAAVAPDGSLAGYTNLYVVDGVPGRGGIDSTLVLAEHRGHRLGLALKVRLHQETRARHPDVHRIATGNADVNQWMNAVNERLGYRLVETSLDLQKVLT